MLCRTDHRTTAALASRREIQLAPTRENRSHREEDTRRISVHKTMCLHCRDDLYGYLARPV